MHTDTNDNTPLLLRCECSGEVLSVEKWDEHGCVAFAIYRAGATNWRWRMRCVWRIIRTGSPYGDDVILSAKDVIRLRDYLARP